MRQVDRLAGPAVPPKGGRNVLAAAASGIRDQVVRDGGDPDEVLSLAGIDRTSLDDGKNAVDLGAYVSMMEIASRHTRNDNFGLHYGQGFTPDMLGLIGAIVLASPDLGIALARMVDLFPYHQQATDTRLVRDGQLLRLEYRILDGRIIDRRQDAELTLGMFTNMFRSCLGKSWAPEQIFCEHPRPLEWRDHERAFNAPVHFSQRTNAIVFWAGDLAAPMPHADLRRLAALQEELIVVAGGTGQIDIGSRVKSEIRSCLADGSVTIEQISDSIRMPRWTLQRRLAKLGLTFSDAVELVRREMAERYLRQTSIPITEIAFLLGYSELSAFSRACSRWYDASPQSCRSVWTTTRSEAH